MTNLILDQEFEEDILCRALRDKDYLKRAARLVAEHHFNTPQHAWVWKGIYEIWTKYREQTTAAHLIARARVDFREDGERAVHLELVRKLIRRQPKAALASLDQLSEFVRTVNAQLAMEAAARSLEKGQVDDVYKALRSAVDRELKPRDYNSIEWISDFQHRQMERKRRREHPEEWTRIPTGFKRLDRILSGGLELCELGLVVATTGVGKSIVLSNLTYNAIARGYPTVYFSLEMPLFQIAQRMDSRWSRMEYKKFKEYDFKPSELRQLEAKQGKALKQFEGLLHIVEMPLRRCDINTVRAALDDLRTEHDFHPKVIILDSADHMRGVGRFESHRLQQAEVYWDIAGLAGEGYGVWTSTQAGKEWKDKIAKAEATAESYDKARIADLVITLNTPEKRTRSTRVSIDDDDGEEAAPTEGPLKPDTKHMELYLAKYRDGKGDITFPLEAEFTRMYIAEAEQEREA